MLLKTTKQINIIYIFRNLLKNIRNFYNELIEKMTNMIIFNIINENCFFLKYI